MSQHGAGRGSFNRGFMTRYGCYLSMPTTISPPTVFPTITTDYILTFQFSSWYPKFQRSSIRSKIVRPLSHEFQQYLDSDSVIVPEGSEDVFVYIFGSLTINFNGKLSPDQPRRLLVTMRMQKKMQKRDLTIPFRSLMLKYERRSKSMAPSFPN